MIDMRAAVRTLRFEHFPRGAVVAVASDESLNSKVTTAAEYGALPELQRLRGQTSEATS